MVWLAAIVESVVLPVVWLAAVAAPVGSETVPVMLFTFHVPLCTAETESVPLARFQVRPVDHVPD